MRQNVQNDLLLTIISPSSAIQQVLADSPPPPFLGDFTFFCWTETFTVDEQNVQRLLLNYHLVPGCFLDLEVLLLLADICEILFETGFPSRLEILPTELETHLYTFKWQSGKRLNLFCDTSKATYGYLTDFVKIYTKSRFPCSQRQLDYLS